MSIPNKLSNIESNVPKVYDSGYTNGYDRGHSDGKKAEYDTFWDSFQGKGKRTDYLYHFAGAGWNDKTYNPKYPITVETNGQFMYQYASITDTKVTIDVSGATMNLVSMFANAKKLVTIRKLICSERNPYFTSLFTNCNSLVNITVEGVIPKSVNMQWCPLSVASMKSVISHLKNYAGTGNELTYSLTFSDACWEALEADSVAPDGGTWKNYVITLGWNT